MNRSRLLFSLLVALALSLLLSACQKKSEEQVSQAPDQASQSAPATPAPDQGAVTPPAQEPAPAEARVTTEPSRMEKPRVAAHRAPRPVARNEQPQEEAAPAAAPKTAEIPVGTTFDVTMNTPCDTRTSNVGDKVEAVLASPLTNSDGAVIAETGATIRGEISQLTRASRSKKEEDRASIAFTFTSIQTVDGEKPLHATVMNSEGKLVAEGTGTRDKLLIGGGAVAGAILGKLAGKDTKSTILGAVGGAVAGTGAVLMAKGHELQVPAGSKVSLRVDEPITVVQQ